MSGTLYSSYLNDPYQTSAFNFSDPMWWGKNDSGALGWYDDPEGISNITSYYDPGNAAASNNSLLGNDFAGGMNDLMGIFGQLGGLFNMFKQWDYQDSMLDLAQNQFGLVEDQWRMTLNELNRINKTANRLNKGYRTGKYAPADKRDTDYKYS